MIQPRVEYKTKDIFLRAHSVPWHPTLLEVDLWFLDTFGIIIYTSTWRLKTTDSGIHETTPLRANDKRSYIYAAPTNLMVREVNDNWQYDPSRPWLNVCMAHDTGSGIHFHTQVHDNTVKI